MPVLRSAVDTSGDAYLANRTGQLAAIAALNEQLELARAGGGARYSQRHHDRGKLLARERIELLVDRDSPLLELSSLAGWGTEFSVGASIVTAIGVVSGVECVLIAHDPTVRGGSMNPYTLRKNLRALEIARLNRLPVVNLVESGGADLPTQSDLFVPAGKIFHDLTELSAMGMPTVALVFGNSTAGGAYVPGMCDYSVLVDQGAKVFLGGPPLVKMATGEESDDESLGGADMHSRVSGLADYFAADELDCSGSAARSWPTCTGASSGPGPASRRTRPPTTRRNCSASSRPTSGPRSTPARCWPGWSTAPGSTSTSRATAPAWSPAGRRSTATRSGCWPTPAACCSARRPRRPPSSSCWPTRATSPLVFLQNTTGYMVGAQYEQGGIIKDGAKMINAVTNSAVPHLTVNMAASFGAGNYGMSGRAYDPRFMFAWANAKLAVMGAQQLAGVMSIVGQASAAATGRPFDAEADERQASADRGPDRVRVRLVLRQRAALRRRGHRPARHPFRARHDAVRGALRPGGRPPRLRRLPDVRGA